MFHSILSKSLRDYRVPMLAWGFGLLVFMATFVAMATPAEVMAYISLVKILSFWGDPYAINTPEGYITFRYMETTLPLLLSIWPALAWCAGKRNAAPWMCCWPRHRRARACCWRRWVRW